MTSTFTGATHNTKLANHITGKLVVGQSAAHHNDYILIANIFQKGTQQLSWQLEEEK